MELKTENAHFVLLDIDCVKAVPADVDFVVAAVSNMDFDLSVEKIKEKINRAYELANRCNKDLWLVYPGDQIAYLGWGYEKNKGRSALLFPLEQLNNSLAVGLVLLTKIAENPSTNRRDFFTGKFLLKDTHAEIDKDRLVATVLGSMVLGLAISDVLTTRIRWPELKKELVLFYHAISAKKIGIIALYYQLKNKYILKEQRQTRVCVLVDGKEQAEGLTEFLKDTKKMDVVIKNNKEKILKGFKMVKDQGFFVSLDDEVATHIEAMKILDVALELPRENRKELSFYNYKHDKEWADLVKNETEFWEKELG